MSEANQATDHRFVVVVIRSGGIAGLRRQWRVEPPDVDAPRWVDLIDRCPWDAPAVPDAGADRFSWTIRARTPGHECERTVSDGELSGPWRDLVDAVRSAHTPGR
jgi:hypothetical protein